MLVVRAAQEISGTVTNLEIFMKLGGITRTPNGEPVEWVRNQQIHGDSMTSTATSGSGVEMSAIIHADSMPNLLSIHLSLQSRLGILGIRVFIAGDPGRWDQGF